MTIVGSSHRPFKGMKISLHLFPIGAFSSSLFLSYFLKLLLFFPFLLFF